MGLSSSSLSVSWLENSPVSDCLPFLAFCIVPLFLFPSVLLLLNYLDGLEYLFPVGIIQSSLATLALAVSALQVCSCPKLAAFGVPAHACTERVEKTPKERERAWRQEYSLSY